MRKILSFILLVVVLQSCINDDNKVTYYYYKDTNTGICYITYKYNKLYLQDAICVPCDSLSKVHVKSITLETEMK